MVSGPLGSDVWTTSFILVNQTSASAPFQLIFFSDNGSPQTVEYTMSGVNSQNSVAAGGIPAKSGLVLEVSASSFISGWAGLSGAGITGQAVFHRHVTPANEDFEATVPLTGGGIEYLVPFDSTSFNGTIPYLTGLAIANLDGVNSANFQCTVYDPSGTNLGTSGVVSLAPLAHTALALNSSSGFGLTAGIQGTLDCISGGPQVAVLGLRFLGTSGLTSFAPIKLQ